MTDEQETPTLYPYQIYLLNGLSFGLTSPLTYREFLVQARSDQYVMTQTDFAPYHAIAIIRAGSGGVGATAADLRSMN